MMPNADTWTCRTCGAVYHRMRDVRSHAIFSVGHQLFDASRRDGASLFADRTDGVAR